MVKPVRMHSVACLPKLQQTETRKLRIEMVILWCLLALGLPALGQPAAATNNEVFLIGFYLGSSPNYHGFWMDSNRLPGKVSWEESKEPFPLSLDAEVRRAGGYLFQQHQITNRLELQKALIKRTVFRHMAKVEPGQVTPGFTNTLILA